MSRVQVAHLRMLTIELINGSFIFIVIAWNHPTYYPFKCANHQFTLHSKEKLPVCQPNKLSQKCSIMRCLWPLANGQLRWFYCFKLVYPPWNNPPKSTLENSNGWKTQTIFHLEWSIFIWFSGALGLVVSFQGKAVNKPWETSARNEAWKPYRDWDTQKAGPTSQPPGPCWIFVSMCSFFLGYRYVDMWYMNRKAR